MYVLENNFPGWLSQDGASANIVETVTGGGTLDLIKATEAFQPWETICLFVYQFHCLRSVLRIRFTGKEEARV